MSQSILVVDDEAQVRELLRDLLESRGHTVCEASNLTEAESLLRSQHPAVALVDGQFPRDATSTATEDLGRSFCLQARAMGARTVLVSCSTELVDAERRAGWAALRKPFDLQAILGAV